MSDTAQQELLEVKARGYDLMLQIDSQFRQITQLNHLLTEIASLVSFDVKTQKPEHLIDALKRAIADGQAPQG